MRSHPFPDSAPLSGAGMVDGPDLNLVVLRGRLASSPELLEAGGALRLLVVVRSELPTRRVDVLPVLVGDPPDGLDDAGPGDPVWVVGSAQRRFVDGSWGPRSRIEVVAEEIRIGVSGKEER